MSLMQYTNSFESKRILEIYRGKNGYGFVLSGQVIYFISMEFLKLIFLPAI